MKHEKKALSDDDMDIINEALQSSTLSSGSSCAASSGAVGLQQKTLKKPAAAHEAAKSKKQKAVSKKPSVKNLEGAGPAEPPGEEPGNGEEKKSSFKHRKTSSAYHKEMARCKRLKMSPQACKKMARAAYASVAQQIDSGVLKEAEDVD